MTQAETEQEAPEQESETGGLAGDVVNAVEHLGESKAAKKAAKSAKKDEKKRAKKAEKEAKQTEKACKKACEAGVDPGLATVGGTMNAEDNEPRITPKKAGNAVSVAKVVIPAVVPVLAPVAVRAAGSAREAYDRYRARKLGVDVDRLAEYSGHGAGLQARIAGASDGLAGLSSVGADVPGPTGESVTTFTNRVQSSLRQLSATVRAAERMPTVRRKAAHRAVAGELDQIESELLRRLSPEQAQRSDQARQTSRTTEQQGT